jgi:ankyrin repeat protein
MLTAAVLQQLGDPEMMRLLIEIGEDPNLKTDGSEMTCLAFAARAGHLQVPH